MDLCLYIRLQCGMSRAATRKGQRMDYSRMGGVKSNYGKVKTRNKGGKIEGETDLEKAKTEMLARMKKAAEARKTETAPDEG